MEVCHCVYFKSSLNAIRSFSKSLITPMSLKSFKYSPSRNTTNDGNCGTFDVRDSVYASNHSIHDSFPPLPPKENSTYTLFLFRRPILYERQSAAITRLQAQLRVVFSSPTHSKHRKIQRKDARDQLREHR